MALRLEDYTEPFGLVAILRGVKPDEVVAIGEALVTAGFRIVEVRPRAVQARAQRDLLPSRGD